MTRDMVVKGDLHEVGVGTIPADLLWESETDAYGAFAHLCITKDGRMVLSITDMEEADGSYVSVEVKFADFINLARKVQSFR